MQVNADEDQMIGYTVNDTTVAAFPTRQTRKLAVRVVEYIRANMEYHPANVDAQIAIEIKVSGNDPEGAGQQAHGRWSHLQLREKLGQPKPYWPVEIEIENSLDFARFVCGFDARGQRLYLLQHQTTSNFFELNPRADWNGDAQMTNDELMSKVE